MSIDDLPDRGAWEVRQFKDMLGAVDKCHDEDFTPAPWNHKCHIDGCSALPDGVDGKCEFHSQEDYDAVAVVVEDICRDAFREEVVNYAEACGLTMRQALEAIIGAEAVEILEAVGKLPFGKKKGEEGD